MVAFDGRARDACRLFPESANVFATLALATVGFDEVRATLIADPAASRVEHASALRVRLDITSSSSATVRLRQSEDQCDRALVGAAGPRGSR